MTDTEIWSALADTFRELGWWQDRELAWHFKNGVRMKNGNPLDDLNACHEMEKVFIYTNGCSEQYGCVLSQVCLQGAQLSDQTARFKVLNATARQRCEAFLRTLNLWTETPERKTDK